MTGENVFGPASDTVRLLKESRDILKVFLEDAYPYSQTNAQLVLEIDQHLKDIGAER